MFLRLSLLLLLLPALTPAGTQVQMIPASERAALIAFHESTGGENWLNSANWLGPPGTEDSWHGITVEEGHVTKILLGGNGLVGSIPPEIGQFSRLKSFSIVDLHGAISAPTAPNRLSGPIPAEIGNLADLEFLNLGGNGFRQIPADMGRLSALHTLFLDGNEITRLPPEIGHLDQLWLLDLSRNHLESLPDSFGSLAGLGRLWIRDNALQELPASLGNLLNLVDLDLRRNPLAELPDTLGNLAGLEVLRIGETRIASLPETFGNLRSLHTLDYSRGDHAFLPRGIGDLRSLRVLLVQDNELDSLPAELAELENLEHLNLRNNRLRTMPPVLVQLPSLQVLELCGNPLIEPISELVFQLEVENLDLSCFSFSGSISPAIGQMQQARVLNLSGNRLSGPIPPEIGQLSQLQELDLSGNELTGPLPPEIGQLTNLKVLALGDNLLTGGIPPEMGNLVNLEILDLGRNLLAGSIPPQLSHLSLAEVRLDGNQLSGEIPAELASIPRLFLGQNQLSGPLPVELWGNDTFDVSDNWITGSIAPEMSRSRVVRLNGNLLTGEVPGEFCEGERLEEFSAASNRLSGALPADFSACQKLRVLNFRDNRLSGPIPRGLGELPLRELYLGANRLKGPVPPDLLSLGKGAGPVIDLSFNGLFAETGELGLFLEEQRYLDQHFEATQTIAPPQPGIEWVTGTNTLVRWEAIPFQEKVGGYEVLFATQPGGPYRLFDRTFNKQAESLQVDGLDTDTEYYIRVRTVTEPHSWNSNRVVSEPGAEIVVQTDGRGNSILPLFSGPRTATGMAFASDSDTSSTLDFQALDPFGNLLGAPFNPARADLLPGEQLTVLSADLLGGNGAGGLYGWMDVGTDNSRFGSLFQILGPAQVDGSVPASGTSTRLYFSRLHQGPGSFRGQPATTLLAVVNPHQEECRLELRYYPAVGSGQGPSGEPVELVRTIPPRGMILSTAGDLLEQEVSGGHLELEVKEGAGVAGFEFLDLGAGNSLVALPAFSHFRGRRLDSPQVAWGPGFFSELNLTNLTSEGQRVRISLVGEPRRSLAEPVLIALGPREQFTADIAALFGLEDGQEIGNGSLRVHSSGGVIGDIVSGDPKTLTFAAGWPLTHRAFVRLVFSHLANTEDIFTGLALDNPAPLPAQIQLSLWSSRGVPADSTEISLPAWARISRLVTEWLPAAELQDGGYLVLTSDQPIFAQQVFGDRKLTFLSVAPPGRTTPPLAAPESPGG